MGPKKKEAQKMSLGDFLGDQTLGSWADEMEDMPVPRGRTGYGGDRGGGGMGGWGGGDRGDRGGGMRSTYEDRGYAVREELPLPTKPPYTAHLGNLSFEVTEGGIQDYLSGCEVTSVRIIEDRVERKPKGFAYVEFGTLDGLKKALQLNGQPFDGRNVRISVADPPKNDRPEARELNDWTRKGPLPDLPGQQRRPSERGNFNRFNDNASEAGSERGAPFERGGSRRGGAPPFEGDGKVRDFGNWERKGPLSPVPGAGPRDNTKTREGQQVPVRERRQSPAWGEGQNRGPTAEGAPRGPRREFQERPPQPERAPTASELDNQWRTKMRPDAPVKSPGETPDVSTPSSPAATPAAPAGRPRLNLQKRTVSEAEPSPSAATGDAKASPFGAARPIDTTAREKEIEEKRIQAAKEKKEADEKAREEKRARDAAAKAEKEKVGAEAKEGDKENGPAAGKSFEILQRSGDNENDEEETVEAENANGEIVEDKAVKPKEVVRNAGPPRRPSAQQQGGGSWRKPGPKKDAKDAAPAAEGTTEQLDADGWSTVPSNTRSRGNRRGGNAPSRAIAS